MYNGVPVLDVHGHVSVPFSANSFLMLMMGSNTPMDSPIGQPKAGPAGVTIEEFRAAAADHARYLDERAIDVQVIGPRPFPPGSGSRGRSRAPSAQGFPAPRRRLSS